MAKNGAEIVFCSSCKILYFASSVHPKIATEEEEKAAMSCQLCRTTVSVCIKQTLT